MFEEEHRGKSFIPLTAVQVLLILVTISIYAGCGWGLSRLFLYVVNLNETDAMSIGLNQVIFDFLGLLLACATGAFGLSFACFFIERTFGTKQPSDRD